MTYSHKTAPKVEVVWKDSCSLGGWGQAPGDRDHTPADCTTMGYLLKRDRKQVVVAQNRGPSKFGEVMVIPSECVRGVRRLK